MWLNETWIMADPMSSSSSRDNWKIKISSWLSSSTPIFFVIHIYLRHIITMILLPIFWPIGKRKKGGKITFSTNGSSCQTQTRKTDTIMCMYVCVCVCFCRHFGHCYPITKFHVSIAKTKRKKSGGIPWTLQFLLKSSYTTSKVPINVCQKSLFLSWWIEQAISHLATKINKK